VGFGYEVIVSIQEMNFLGLSSGNPVSDKRHLCVPAFLYNHLEFPACSLFNVLAFVENSAQLDSINPRYNVVGAFCFHA